MVNPVQNLESNVGLLTADDAHPSSVLDIYGIRCPDSNAVAGYLRSYSNLARLLPGICERVREEFPTPDQLVLHVYRDPEFDDTYLTLTIRPQQIEPNIIDRIDRLVDRFSDQLECVSGYLLLTTDFQPANAHEF